MNNKVVIPVALAGAAVFGWWLLHSKAAPAIRNVATGGIDSGSNVGSGHIPTVTANLAAIS